MIPVILSGGSGSRLWPLSRKQFPKQFLALTGEHTLFQQTLERLVFEGMDTPIVVCNKDHRFIVNEQLSRAQTGNPAHPDGTVRPQHRAGRGPDRDDAGQ